MKVSDILKMADQVAEISKKEGIKITSACYTLFEEEGIPEDERPDLCSAICRELGSRGGAKKTRNQRPIVDKRREERALQTIKERTEKILAEAELNLLLPKPLSLKQAKAIRQLRQAEIFAEAIIENLSDP